MGKVLLILELASFTVHWERQDDGYHTRPCGLNPVMDIIRDANMVEVEN